MASPASALGQKIGETFDEAVLRLLKKYVDKLGFALLKPEEGKKLVHLTPIHGISKQVDHVIVEKGRRDPLVVVEIKWLKDSRHIYDKGGWIGGMEKILYQNPTVRGAMAVLAGYWSPRILQQIQYSRHITAIVMATTDEVYSIFARYGVTIDIDKRRNAIANPAEALAQFEALTGEERAKLGDEIVEGKSHQLFLALRSSLTPVDELSVESIEVVLRTNQGNILRQAFTSPEQARNFVDTYTGEQAAVQLKRVIKEASTPYQTSLFQDD
jgi:hypothetical protein